MNLKPPTRFKNLYIFFYTEHKGFLMLNDLKCEKQLYKHACFSVIHTDKNKCLMQHNKCTDNQEHVYQIN